MKKYNKVPKPRYNTPPSACRWRCEQCGEGFDDWGRFERHEGKCEWRGV